MFVDNITFLERFLIVRAVTQLVLQPISLNLNTVPIGGIKDFPPNEQLLTLFRLCIISWWPEVQSVWTTVVVLMWGLHVNDWSEPHFIHDGRFNEFASLGIQALEDVHMRAQYELFPDVLLITNGIKNSLKVNPSGECLLDKMPFARKV